MNDNSSNPFSWIIPSSLSAIVGLAAIWQAYQIAAISQETQKTLEISKAKLEIVRFAKQYDKKSSKILLEHVLKPIESKKLYKKFRNDLLSLNSEIAPTSSAPAKETQVIIEDELQAQSKKANGTEFYNLVEKFPTDERLTASDKLVLAYKEYPKEVVASLVNGLLQENNKWSYRVNLYIAFTFARIQPNWTGTEEQIEQIKISKTQNIT